MIGQAWSYFVMAMEEVHLVVNLAATTACIVTLFRVLSSLIKIEREVGRLESPPRDERVLGRSSLENARRATMTLKGALFASILFTGGMVHWVYAGLPKIVSSQQSTMWGLAVIAVMLVVYQLGGIFVDMLRDECPGRSPGENEKCSG